MAMPRRHSRAHEKFLDAEYKLAVGEGDVRSRLRSAFIVLNRLHEDDLPPELLEDWKWIMHQLTRFGPEHGKGGEVWQTAIDHTMSRIRNSADCRENPFSPQNTRLYAY